LLCNRLSARHLLFVSVEWRSTPLAEKMSTPPLTPLTAAPVPPDGVLERLFRLINALPDAVMCLNRAWQITYANAEAARISRLEPEHIGTKTHWELFPETVGTEAELIYREAMESHQPATFEFTYEPFGVTMCINVLPTDEGLALHYRDTTAQRSAERREREQADRLREVLEATSDAVATIDREWRYSYLNSRAKQMLLDPHGRLLGKVIWQEFPDAAKTPAWDAYHRSMDERLPAQAEIYYGDPLNIWLSLHSWPTADGIVVFFRDATQQKTHAAALRAEQEETERRSEELKSIYATAPVGLALLDPVEFRLLNLNDHEAAILGFPKAEILGRPLHEIALIPGLVDIYRFVAQGNVVKERLVEGEIISRPGERRAWNVNYSPIYNEDGTVRAISTAAIEITNQKKAEAALIRSEKLAAVGRLASSISHEINNPLEAITNLLYLIAMDDDLPADLRSYVQLAQSELSRVSQIATQTLRFHRQAVAPTAVTAADLVNAVIRLYTGRLTNSHIQVDARYSTETKVICFENDIRQVLNNLIANAIDAMRTGGRLLARAHEVHDAEGRPGVRITIADTGHGMSKAVVDRLFEPFFTTKDLNGTGLGLWISHGIVERHKGRLSVRSSDAPDHHGTVFSLFLPLENPASSLAP
jgi:PAS domain S-box-containing protein